MSKRYGYGKVCQNESDCSDVEDEHERLPAPDRVRDTINKVLDTVEDATGRARAASQSLVDQVRRVPRGNWSTDMPELKSTSPMLNRKTDGAAARGGKSHLWNSQESNSLFT